MYDFLHEQWHDFPKIDLIKPNESVVSVSYLWNIQEQLQEMYNFLNGFRLQQLCRPDGRVTSST